MNARILAVITLLVCHPASADGLRVKDLMMQALISQDGTSKGIVAGQEADAIHTVTGASDPLRAEVSTLKKFKQEGCSRLAVRLIQPNVPTKEGGKTDFALRYELNLCKSGLPPPETLSQGASP